MRTGLNASDIPATENGLALLSANEVHIPSEDFWSHFRKNAADGFSGLTCVSQLDVEVRAIGVIFLDCSSELLRTLVQIVFLRDLCDGKIQVPIRSFGQ